MKEEIRQAVRDVQIMLPEWLKAVRIKVRIPNIEVQVPEVHIPEIHVQLPLNVDIPEIQLPEIHIPKIRIQILKIDLQIPHGRE